jgi:cystathionine beta-lyase/cystathionine gamma-synthase
MPLDSSAPTPPPDAAAEPEARAPDESEGRGFATRCVHAGQQPDPASGAIMTPIYQTSTYAQAAPGDHKGHEYARVSNPTRSALEANLAALEGAAHGICFSSGVAGIDAIAKGGLRPGDHVVATNDLYGGTFRLFKKVFEPFGLTFTFTDLTDPAAVEAAMRPATKLLWVETPTNPLLRVSDIARLAEIADANGADVAVDNTFASPALQQPLDLGADLVLHSATKYLGGHSDLILGAVCTDSDEWAEKLRFQIKSAGAAPGPMDCFLALRGTKTLHLRMQRHCQSAQAVAEFLDEHPKVGRVRYPGLPDDPAHETAQKQMSGFGGMVAFALDDDRVEAAKAFIGRTDVFELAESLGGVESLIEHPASMTHASIPAEERRKAGLLDSLIRLSVGVEDEGNLIADLDRALAAA